MSGLCCLLAAAPAPVFPQDMKPRGVLVLFFFQQTEFLAFVHAVLCFCRVAHVGQVTWGVFILRWKGQRAGVCTDPHPVSCGDGWLCSP